MGERAHRALAIECHHHCWELVEPDRSADDVVELVTVAFASRHHWRTVGTAEQSIVTDWMVVRRRRPPGFGRPPPGSAG